MDYHDCFSKNMLFPLDAMELHGKKWYQENPAIDMQKPYNIREFSSYFRESDDIVKSLAKRSRILISHQDEAAVFQTEKDIEITPYQRYFPCLWHSHECFELLCICEGSCTAFFDGETASLSKGDVLIISSGAVHAISAASDSCIGLHLVLRQSTFERSFINILDGESILAEFFRRTMQPDCAYPFLLFKTKCNQRLFNILADLYHEFTYNYQFRDHMLNNIMESFFLNLMRYHQNNIVLPKHPGEYKAEKIFHILRYIENHFATLSMDELEAVFGYSPRQLQRLIHTSSGRTYRELVSDLKIKRAEELLSKSNMSLNEIAEKCGYSDERTFSFAFKRQKGITPSAYKRNLSGSFIRSCTDCR